jgi:hypothetical protein
MVATLCIYSVDADSIGDEGSGAVYAELNESEEEELLSELG